MRVCTALRVCRAAAVCAGMYTVVKHPRRASCQCDISDDFLAAIPKTDLHVHLDGSVRLNTLIELAKKYDVPLPAYTEEEMYAEVFKTQYSSLSEYLKGFQYTTAVMQHPEALSRVAYEFAVDNFAEGVHYFECRFAPQLFASLGHEGGMDIPSVLKHIDSGLRRACEEFNSQEAVVQGKKPPFAYGIIVCGMRSFDSSQCDYYKHFAFVHAHEPQERVYGLASTALVEAALHAREKLGIPVVGLDIAGPENGHPPKTHVHAYDIAQRHFLNKTVHAGEDYGPESIFQAITHLHADRIGHGYHIFSSNMIDDRTLAQGVDPTAFVEGLARYVANRRVCLEVCLTSNRQTMPHLQEDLTKHAFKTMLEHGISVCLNTDNRTVSQTSVTNELRLAVDTFDLTHSELRNIVLEGFKRSFFPGPYVEKQKYLDQIFQYYAEVCDEHGVPFESRTTDQHALW